MSMPALLLLQKDVCLLRQELYYGNIIDRLYSRSITAFLLMTSVPSTASATFIIRLSARSTFSLNVADPLTVIVFAGDVPSVIFPMMFMFPFMYNMLDVQLPSSSGLMYTTGDALSQMQYTPAMKHSINTIFFDDVMVYNSATFIIHGSTR